MDIRYFIDPLYPSRISADIRWQGKYPLISVIRLRQYPPANLSICGNYAMKWSIVSSYIRLVSGCGYINDPPYGYIHWYSRSQIIHQGSWIRGVDCASVTSVLEKNNCLDVRVPEHSPMKWFFQLIFTSDFWLAIQNKTSQAAYTYKQWINFTFLFPKRNIWK